MIINWYPGHMAKAKRLIQENLKIIDVVIELVDARIPMSSTNPMIKSLIGDKPSVVVLNKADLADPAVLDEWVAYYKQQGRKVLALNSKGGKGVKQLISLVRSLAAPKLARWKARGLKNRAVRTMILGIPNVGKSTLINKLSRRSAAKTADKPGETKGKQWVHIGDQLDLLDTPGVLWPKLENQVSAYRLAATGAISDTVFDMETVIMQLIEQLSAQYPDELKARYKLETLCDKPLDTIEAIGLYRFRRRRRPGKDVQAHPQGIPRRQDRRHLPGPAGRMGRGGLTMDIEKLRVADLKARLAAGGDVQDLLAAMKEDCRVSVRKLAAAYMRQKIREEAERERVLHMYAQETAYYNQGLYHVAGIDEAGRGPAAGPVMVGRRHPAALLGMSRPQ